MERPEHEGPAEEYFNEKRASKYVHSLKLSFLRRTIVPRVVRYLRQFHPITWTPGQCILDIGCGTCYLKDYLENEDVECKWFGCDISTAMLEAGHVHAHGYAVVSDIGQGLPYRAGVFDACVSVSTLQWLCYSYRANDSALERAHRFFKSLHFVLSSSGTCVFQFYPEDNEQVRNLTEIAITCKFYALPITDYKNMNYGNQSYLILSKQPLINTDREFVQSYYWGWQPPMSRVIGKLFFGWKPDYRKLLKVESGMEVIMKERERSNGASMGLSSFPKYLSTSTGVFFPEELILLLLEAYFPALDSKNSENVESPVTENCVEKDPIEEISNINPSDEDLTNIDNYDKFRELVDWVPVWKPPLTWLRLLPEAELGLRTFRCVCKQWYSFLSGVDVEVLRWGKAMFSWQVYKRLPSPWELELEQNIMAAEFVRGLSGNEDPHGKVQALYDTAEYYYLNQFFIWVQLLKYVPLEEQHLLGPPSDVREFLCTYSSCAPEAFRNFGDKFCGRDIPLSYPSEQIVDVSQSYRELTRKQRAQFGFYFSNEELQIRNFTWLWIAKLFHRVDGHTWHPSASDLSCFGGETKIKMGDGTKREVRFLSDGDEVMGANGASLRVVSVERCVRSLTKKMVRFSDFWITRGHPVFVNGDWFRPDELLEARDIDISLVYGIYNLHLAGSEHTVIAGDENEVVCCTLGKYCGDRLEKLYPQQNAKYGRKDLKKNKIFM